MRRVEIKETFLLGCVLRNADTERLLKQKGAVLLPRFAGLAYSPYRSTLYTSNELLKEVCPGRSLDQTIFDEFSRRGKFPPDVLEAIMRGIHDDSIDDALEQLIKDVGGKNIVGIMGGSGTPRDDKWYRKTAQTARLLAREKYFVMTGGG